MTRKEQLEGAAQQRNMCVGGKGNIHTALIREFIAGAQWADKTMIDKACEYIEDVGDGICIPDMKKFIEAFRKAMEE